MRKALKYLEGRVTTSEVVTDASKSVISMLSEFVCVLVCVHVCVCVCTALCSYNIKYLAKDFPHLYHSLDVWHKSKKLKKSLLEVKITCYLVTCISVCKCSIRPPSLRGRRRLVCGQVT